MELREEGLETKRKGKGSKKTSSSDDFPMKEETQESGDAFAVHGTVRRRQGRGTDIAKETLPISWQTAKTWGRWGGGVPKGSQGVRPGKTNAFSALKKRAGALREEHSAEKGNYMVSETGCRDRPFKIRKDTKKGKQKALHRRPQLRARGASFSLL